MNWGVGVKRTKKNKENKEKNMNWRKGSCFSEALKIQKKKKKEKRKKKKKKTGEKETKFVLSCEERFCFSITNATVLALWLVKSRSSFGGESEREIMMDSFLGLSFCIVQ